MITQNTIESIKQHVDIVALVRSKGVQLKKNGKGYKGVCPFHEDDDPSFSVNPEKNLWNCFGCDRGGDAIRFVELIDGVDFKEAVKWLADDTPITGKSRTRRKGVSLIPSSSRTTKSASQPAFY